MPHSGCLQGHATIYDERPFLPALMEDPIGIRVPTDDPIIAETPLFQHWHGEKLLSGRVEQTHLKEEIEPR